MNDDHVAMARRQILVQMDDCHNLVTVPAVRLDPEPAGRLDVWTRLELDRTLAYSLDIRS